LQAILVSGAVPNGRGEGRARTAGSSASVNGSLPSSTAKVEDVRDVDTNEKTFEGFMQELRAGPGVGGADGADHWLSTWLGRDSQACKLILLLLLPFPALKYAFCSSTLQYTHCFSSFSTPHSRRSDPLQPAILRFTVLSSGRGEGDRGGSCASSEGGHSEGNAVWRRGGVLSSPLPPPLLIYHPSRYDREGASEHVLPRGRRSAARYRRGRREGGVR